MNIFVDCEFNGYQGQLLSMGLVAEDGLGEWYEVYGYLNPERIDPWVKENVVPRLYDFPNGGESLEEFLNRYEEVNIIADWPDDIKYFCQCLVVGPGMRVNTPPLTMEIIRDINSEKSAVPHNALHDARAIRESWLALRAA